MVKEVAEKGKKIFKCDVCGFGYLDNQMADKCENYCKAHGACSLEITKHAVSRG